ncbi:MAG: hypothetical protein ACAH89_06290, partial [Rariglobus sp.]
PDGTRRRFIHQGPSSNGPFLRPPLRRISAAADKRYARWTLNRHPFVNVHPELRLPASHYPLLATFPAPLSQNKTLARLDW